MIFHPLHTDIPKPERFTYPFCYEPHPLCLLAAEEVQREIDAHEEWRQEGKMFGVLVAESATGELGFLAAYSGLLAGRNDWPYFVPAVFDAQQPDGHYKQTEAAISDLNRQIREMAEDDERLEALKATRKQMSEDLQRWLFDQYQMLNAHGKRKDLVEIWRDYHFSPKLRKRFPMPPGGSGDCCAPKLLQYAYRQQMRPVCMAEFWWGESPKSDIRHHGQFYPACRGKCKPILTWMLEGLQVDVNPETLGFPHLRPRTVYEDDSLIVLNKPSGLLSIPGRTERYSVATIMKKRFPDSILAHRLDMWTSGLIIVAKNKEAHQRLQAQFTERSIRKRYTALLSGDITAAHPAGEHGTISLPLLCDPLNRPRQVVDYSLGKKAVTEYRILGTTDGHTRVALYPHTGRTHQLRMHCAHPDGLGCPILGDELYGQKTDRLYLHAEAIEFTHPVTGKRIFLERKADF